MLYVLPLLKFRLVPAVQDSIIWFTKGHFEKAAHNLLPVSMRSRVPKLDWGVRYVGHLIILQSLISHCLLFSHAMLLDHHNPCCCTVKQSNLTKAMFVPPIYHPSLYDHVSRVSSESEKLFLRRFQNSNTVIPNIFAIRLCRIESSV